MGPLFRARKGSNMLKNQQPDDGLNTARGCINATFIVAGAALVWVILAIIVLSL